VCSSDLELHPPLPPIRAACGHSAHGGVGTPGEPVRKAAMSFDRPDLLWLSVLLPLAAAAFMLLYARRRRRVAQALGELSLLERLGGRGLAAFPWRRVLLVVPAAAALGFATLGPRWGTRDEVTESRSANVGLTMDISKSML